MIKNLKIIIIILKAITIVLLKIKIKTAVTAKRVTNF